MKLFAAIATRLPSRKLISQFSGASGLQALQMILSAVVGFMIVRHLSKEQFAQLNLLNTGIATIVSWSGMTIAGLFVSFANQTDEEKISSRDAASIFRRLNFPVHLVGIAAGLIFWIVSASTNGWINTQFMISMSIALMTSICLYSYRFPESAFKVAGRPLLPFRVSIYSEMLRLVLIAAVIYLILPVFPDYGPLLLVVATFIATVWSLNSLWKHYKKENHGLVKETEKHKVVYWRLFKPLIFPSYFNNTAQFFRGSMIYWISSGSVVAEAAALGRLMMLFAMVDKAVELVVIPKLGGLKPERKFLKALGACVSGMLLIGATLTLSAWLLPDLWLWLLGEKYENLDNALIWAVASASVERISGLILFGQLAQGQTRNQWWVPLLATATYMSSIAYFGMDTADKATMALFIGAITNLLAQGAILALRLRKS